MHFIRITSTAAAATLVLIFGTIIPSYAQHEQQKENQSKPERQEARPPQQQQHAQPAQQPQQQRAQQPQQQQQHARPAPQPQQQRVQQPQPQQQRARNSPAAAAAATAAARNTPSRNAQTAARNSPAAPATTAAAAGAEAQPQQPAAGAQPPADEAATAAARPTDSATPGATAAGRSRLGSSRSRSVVSSRRFAWQQQQGWQHGGGWQGHSTFQQDRAQHWDSRSSHMGPTWRLWRLLHSSGPLQSLFRQSTLVPDAQPHDLHGVSSFRVRRLYLPARGSLAGILGGKLVRYRRRVHRL